MHKKVEEILQCVNKSNDPISYARALLEATGISTPPTDVIEILKLLGIQMQGFSYRGVPGYTAADDMRPLSRGWLRRDSNGDLIMIHKYTPSRAARFTLMHEVAHYLIPSHIAAGISEKLHIDDAALLRYEYEANAFAAEALMPIKLFSNDMSELLPGLGAVKYLADRNQTSLEATWNRYLSITPDACAIVCCEPVEKGRRSEFNVTYFNKSSSFEWVIAKKSTISKVDLRCALDKHEQGIIPTSLESWQLSLKGHEVFCCQAMVSNSMLSGRNGLLLFLLPRSRQTVLPTKAVSCTFKSGFTHVSKALNDTFNRIDGLK